MNAEIPPSFELAVMGIDVFDHEDTLALVQHEPEQVNLVELTKEQAKRLTELLQEWV